MQRTRLVFSLASIVLAVLVSPFAAHATTDDPRVVDFPDLELTLTLPPLTELTTSKSSDAQVKQQWSGKLGGVQVEISLALFKAPEFEFSEPSELCTLIEGDLRKPRSDRRYAYDFEPRKSLAGAFGIAPYAVLSRAAMREKDGTKITGSFFLLCGLLDDGAYAVRAATQPAVGAAEEKALLEFFNKGIAYKGKARDPKWTDDQARKRWELVTPPELHKKYDGPLRTAHYIILTDSSGGKAFGQKMEECYAAIKKVYPFEEVPGRALMPVFLFRTNTEYYEFFHKVHEDVSLEAAARSKGHASGDYYATWYEAPQDPVHIHEATHQIFANRLGLTGGGSWFQEGVAEYISSVPNERGNAARDVKKGRQMPIEQFVAVPSLLYSTSGDDTKSNEAGDNYKLAALLIEFLRESKWGKDKFQDFIHKVGAVKRNDVPAIEAAVHAVYGTDLKGLEAQWIEYCKKR